MSLYEEYVSQSNESMNQSFSEHRELYDWTTDWAEYIDTKANDSDNYS